MSTNPQGSVPNKNIGIFFPNLSVSWTSMMMGIESSNAQFQFPTMFFRLRSSSVFMPSLHRLLSIASLPTHFPAAAIHTRGVAARSSG
ncbi:hypothetical protein Csa_000870 [Cucumis sativus]|uniref:Uncharacterized protein n=1 Tax=Cucumis sativus TaxID=3659 RepID=A0A0A0LGY9_CUCSA|nr:hypothetical protein Csa_000870 [Cucumis sativus]